MVSLTQLSQPPSIDISIGLAIYIAHPCAQHTYTKTTLRAHCVQAMRPNNKRTYLLNDSTP